MATGKWLERTQGVVFSAKGFRFFIDSERIFAYSGKGKYPSFAGRAPSTSYRPELTATGSTAWAGAVSSPKLPATNNLDFSSVQTAARHPAFPFSSQEATST